MDKDAGGWRGRRRTLGRVPHALDPSGVPFGVGFAAGRPAPQAIETARLAEALGYDALWLTDSHLAAREVYTLLGAIAVSTERLQLGPGVSHLAGRHPSVLASAIGTLAELAPGRVRLGIGVGDTGARNLGVPRASLRELEAAVGAIRGLLSGEAVDGPSHPLRLAWAPSGPSEPSRRSGSSAPSRLSVPIVIAASGERTQQLCGRIGDVALISAIPAELPAAVQAVRSGEAAAGRPAGACRILLWTTVSVDDDPKRARAAVRGSVARRALNTLARPARAGTLAEPEAAALARLQQAHAAGQHDEADVAGLVPEAWIDRFAIAGTPDEVRARLEAAVGDGADEIAMILMGPGPGQRGTADQLERFAESVLRPMRAVPSAALLGRSTAVAQPAQAEPREERQ